MNTKHTTPEQILEQQCLQGNLFSFIDLTDAIDDPRVFQNYLTRELYPGKRPKWSVESPIDTVTKMKPMKKQKKMQLKSVTIKNTMQIQEKETFEQKYPQLNDMKLDFSHVLEPDFGIDFLHLAPNGQDRQDTLPSDQDFKNINGDLLEMFGITG